MQTKTCGECQWYDYHHLLCVVGGDVAPTDCACCNFTPIKLTNGDRIRQMSDKELAKVIECPHFEGGCIHYATEYSCKRCKRDWLKQEAKDE